MGLSNAPAPPSQLASGLSVLAPRAAGWSAATLCFGTNAKCRPHRPTSEFGGKAEKLLLTQASRPPPNLWEYGRAHFPVVMVAHIRGANQCPSQLYQRNERTYRCLSQRWPSSRRRLVELRASGGITGSRSATTGTYAITVATASRLDHHSRPRPRPRTGCPSSSPAPGGPR
jgi:hypothetical protein